MTGDDQPCSDVTALASAFLDGELEGAGWAHLQRHLAACASCAEYVRQISLTVEVIRKLPGKVGDDTRTELVRRYREWAASRH
jgi:anti-sigma factor RsiW